MRAGAKAAAAVFFGVAAVMGGLAWLLVSAGHDADAEGDDAARRPGLGGRRRPKQRDRDANLVAEPPTPVKPVEKANALVDVPGHPDAKQRDWKEIAAAWTDLVDQPRQRFLGRIDPMDEEARLRTEKMVQRYNRAALEPLEGQDPTKPPMTDMHPGFVGNLVPAVLERAGAPLSAEQARRVAELVVATAGPFDQADVDFEKIRMQDPLTRDFYMLDAVADRAKTADAFYDGLYEVLTSAQAELFVPTEYRFRSFLDSTSSGRFWSLGMSPFPIVDMEDGARALTDRLATQCGLIDREKSVRAVVAQWLAGDPMEPFDSFDERNAFTRRRCITANRRMSELLHSLFDQLDREQTLTPETKAKIRDFSHVLVPVRVHKTK